MKINDAFPSSYLKAADLNGKAVRVTIESVSVEKLGDDQKPILHFVGKEKALVLNKTNSNRIIEAVGSDETDDWEGWSIALYACKVDFQGKRVDAIRVDDRPGASRGPGLAGRSTITGPSRASARRPEPEPADDLDGALPSAPDMDDSDIPF